MTIVIYMPTHLNRNLFLIFLSLYSSIALSQDSKISIAGAAFSPLDGGKASSLWGCYINRLPDEFNKDGNMYAGIDVPIGATITGITAHFFDIALPKHDRPKLILRKSNAISYTIELATAQLQSASLILGYHTEFADIDPGYVVQEDEFFDLIFVPGESLIVNAYYICGLEVSYQLTQ